MEIILCVDVLQLKEVTKEFGSRAILDRVSFSVSEGDVFGIIGQSGSGKTTLLNTIIGFYEPDEGKIFFCFDENKKPKEIHRNLTEIKKKVGFASQVTSFYPKLTIKENLQHFGNLYGLKKITLKNNIRNLLQFTELGKYQDKLAEHLSVGMQKRLELSCSLIHKPRILLLDEPTANLDPLIKKEIIHLIKQANQQGITVIIASHHLDEVDELCNKIALIHDGKLAVCGKLDEIKKPYSRREGVIYLRANEDHHKLIGYLKGLSVDKIIDRGDSIAIYSDDLSDTLHDLLSLVKKKNIALQDLDVRKPSLKEIFEDIIKKKKDKSEE